MMTSSRPRGDVARPGNFASRRGHGSQLSISDPSHHVTEAIGTMYGEDDDSGAEDGRPLSFISSQRTEPSEDRLRLVRTTSDQMKSAAQGVTSGNGKGVGANGNGASTLKKAQTMPTRIPSQRSNSYEGPKSPLPPPSPTPSMRESSQFALTNIDNPKDIAQEFSNLQALRRMSMDVGNNSDPDLLPFSTMSLVAMPSIAPTGDDDEADPSRLLWVPARVHPELEPTAFKNFLENRVQSMKRRSGDSMLSSDGSQRANSTGLRRKKSMLSRQINTQGDSGNSYMDGAERLTRQLSLKEHPVPELSLDDLINDPTKAVQKITQDTLAEGEGDIIVSVAPGMGLRRSTRTQYRKGGGGSIRTGDRTGLSKRVGVRPAEAQNEEPPPVPAIDPALKALTRVLSDPVAENFSRPTRSQRKQQGFVSDDTTAVTGSSLDGSPQEESESSVTSPPKITLPPRSSSAAAQRSTAPPVPKIVETPPEEIPPPARTFPQRSSSQGTTPETKPVEPPPARSAKRQGQGRLVKEQPAHGEVSNINEIAQPAALPGGGASSTSSLTFIPTANGDEKKLVKKTKEKDDAESVTSTKSTGSGWKWFKSDKKEKEREREREREKEREEQAKKASKAAVDKSHDTARLDVLQSSIDTVSSKGRESLLLERDSVDTKLVEERKKESNRKVSESKKEKDGFFGGLFGGSKKKSDKEPGHKKKELRPLTPDPPARQLRADVDYPWSRFPIIEERAIYRMAHIKLANPRRSLQSQVLLSNFMYSYLAKVQAMHPQLNVPMSPQQKRQEEERKRRESEQAQLQMEQQLAQQQAAQNGEDFDFEYHRSGSQQYGDSPTHQDDGIQQYVDDSQIYDYEHGNDGHDESRSHQNGGQDHHYGRQGNGGQHQQQDYYYGRDNNSHQNQNRQYDDDDENNDMW
ncbi:hypothetical protein B0T19DRAFT_124161 [Cercophora scortea]|uniref:Protein Zds1 C-terminal domain-containing protein n=1 Tax=Cercophora scortea TaxID=314031 RepID=A0AAE0IY51_9PEZI|nr:hypothetical protein B0T19DRAFT_124161 [Cercophora scortea]